MFRTVNTFSIFRVTLQLIGYIGSAVFNILVVSSGLIPDRLAGKVLRLVVPVLQFVSTGTNYWTKWPLILIFCVYVLDHSWIESQGQGKRSRSNSVFNFSTVPWQCVDTAAATPLQRWLQAYAHFRWVVFASTPYTTAGAKIRRVITQRVPAAKSAMHHCLVVTWSVWRRSSIDAAL